jgi:hypothetical protein
MLPPDVSSDLEGLAARIQEIERRLSALEHPTPLPPAAAIQPAASSAASLAAGESSYAPPQSSVFSIFGTAVLGIAGAYLLRAVEESGAFPPALVVSLALLYAVGWLVWAAWPRALARLARHSYALTAALILSPMLWEVTVRFRVLDPRVTAAVLAGFALLSVVLAWRSNVSAVLYVGFLAAILTSLALMAGTRDPLPFVLALFAMAAIAESAALLGRWRPLRSLAGLAADFAALILVVILGDARSIPPEYQPVAAGALIALVASLWAIYASSLAIRTLVLRRSVAFFDIVQVVATVLLVGWAVLRITHGAGLLALGVVSLIVGAASYIAAFGPIDRLRQRTNFHFYSACAVVLVLTGCFLALPHILLVIWLCLAAVIATFFCVRIHSSALDLHGIAYLSAALVSSGLMVYAGRALAGSFPPPPRPLPILAAVVALLCTAIVSRNPGEHAAERFVRLLPAVLAVYAAAALAVAALVWLITRSAAPTLPLLAVIRTLVTSAVALLLAFVGARWKHSELIWMAYAAAVLGCLKLALEDLRFGNNQSLAVSLLIYGVVLILIPRMVRAGKRSA